MLTVTRAAYLLTEFPRKMRVAGRRLDLAVPEQLPDHGQTLAKRACARRDAARHIEEIVLQGAEADARRLHVEAIPDGECGRAVVIGGNGLKARREPWA